MREKILGFIAYLIIRTLGMTFRYQLHFPDKETEAFFKKCFIKTHDLDKSYLLAFFHQDELCLLNYFRNKLMSVLISISKDGEIMNQAAMRLGYLPVRGSSSKKAISGLIAAIKKVKEGHKMAFAVDGPRGPIYKVKEGLPAISKKTEVPILPVRAYASRVKIFEKSWNRAKFPLPFSKIDIHFARPAIYSALELEQVLKDL